MLPNLESFKDGKQFLIMCVVIQLHCSESVGVKDNQINFIFFINNRKNCNESIVQSIGFYNKLSIGNPMSKNGSEDKCLLKRIESIMTERVELPRDILLDEVCQWNNNIQIVKDEPVIEISKT